MERDPRLIEMELLASLDALAARGTTTRYSKPNPYGGEDHLVHEAWVALARNLAVTTDYTPAAVYEKHPDLHPDPNRESKQIAVAIMEWLGGGRAVDLRITHAGRLRLFRLRAELDAGRIRDKFGILWDDRHWLTDLQVRVWMRKPGEPISIIVADLDHFKSVNDTLGHDEGDQGIRLFRSILRDVVATGGGEAYAMGGDEGAVVLPGVKREHAEALAERIRQAVEEAFRMFGTADGQPKLAAQPTASIGVGTFDDACDPSRARGQVDKVMYEAKKSGRNRVVSKSL